MKRAEKIDAVKTQKFYFRQFLSPPDMSDPCISEIFKKIPAPNYEDCDPDAVGFRYLTFLLFPFYCLPSFVGDLFLLSALGVRPVCGGRLRGDDFG